MTDAQKANELPEFPTEGGATAEEQDMPLRQETTPSSSPACEEPISSQSGPDKQPAPGLLSMPCLLKELHRDSAPGQPQETDPPPAATQEDSDSSACLRSPSSSGHLGDSDTLSSAEEAAAPVQTAGRKSRRSHSESDASTVAMAAKKNRCQEKHVNGRVRVRGPRSQQQKQRMRQLRQKREAAARRKPDVLQDSSTSDSDITAHSSSSSPLTASSDNEGETINSHAPVGPAVIGHYDISDTHSEQERQSQSLSGAVEVKPSQVSLASTDSEVEIVGVQENASVVSRFPRGGVIQSLSSWKQRAPAQWTSVSAQSGWVPPPEVVDLTLDEDRHRYLL
ncbi:protein C18orf25 homolog isoform X2 [Carassius gibelio]|uniref:protein C18orf25 homolog isoform X2 n=1 Tax=Carassius gibelio TaxID=101364 RepID=UPI00227772F2|nr:protein C18orf25 homolog isoform X2 [Carassius gibelio]